jgi:transposase
MSLQCSGVELSESEILPAKPKRQKLTDQQRAMIVEKHREDSSLSQKRIAEWAGSQFGVEGLSQNTVSRILSSAAESRQSGKLTHAQRKLILEENERHPSMTQKQLSEFAQRRFNLEKAPSQSTISAIINQKLKSMSKDAVIADDSKKRLRTVQYPELEEALRYWVLQCEEKRLAISGALIQEQARRFAFKLKIPESELPKFSVGWLVKFQQRHNLRSVKFCGESGSADEQAIRDHLPGIIEEVKKYRPCDVFNMDETGLFYRMAPDKTIATKNLKGSKKDKARITIALTANADGTEKLPLLFIGNFGKPRAFKKKSPQQLGFLYKFNKKAWMTAVVFQDWLLDIDKTFRKEQRNILLLLDNAPTHIVSNLELTNVTVRFLPPNTTSRIQPMDAGIIAAFKKRYRSFQLQHALALDDAGEPDIFKVDILQGIRWALAAWTRISRDTISNCWKHSGISTSNDIATVSDEAEVDNSLATFLKDLHLEDAMTVSEMTNNPDEMEHVHMILDDDDLIELVTGKAAEENLDESEGEDEVKELVSLDHHIQIVQQAIVVLTMNPEEYGNGLRDLRTLLGRLKEEGRLQREASIIQPSITHFFSKST